MKIKFASSFLGILSLLLLVGCQSDPNSPNRNNNLSDQLGYSTVDNDLALMKSGGMQLDSAAGVFSIGWNEMFRPFMDTAEIKGMAFAVGFGERNTDLPHFKKFGLDMGEVFINYSGNHIQMNKKFHERRGVAYSLFKRPFGHSENLLEFIPNSEYEFEVTGSETFEPITISLISPTALLDITSPVNGQVVDPAQDLTISWEGGKEGKVGIRLMPDFRYRGGHDGGHRGPGPDQNPPLHRVIFIILETNTGTYTFSAEQIQELLNGIQANGLRTEVSQMDFGEVEHENGTLRTAMRNGSSVMLRIEQ